YMALNRPILAIGPTDADYAKIIRETQSGKAHGFNDINDIKHTLEGYFNLYQLNKLQIKSTSFEKYSRKSLAQKIMKLVE
ncbi:MAG TPA: hypothetical protein VKA10_10810, partial [Prolixibacteraceae bacterium]|nr:hypothetical protein [Prolixibacteraceae bacterium]